MTIKAIKDAMHSNRPFKLRTADGRKIEVPHSDFAAVSRDGRTFVLTTPQGSLDLINISLITALEMSEAGTPA